MRGFLGTVVLIAGAAAYSWTVYRKLAHKDVLPKSVREFYDEMQQAYDEFQEEQKTTAS